MLIENALSDAVRFFHMDALSSSVGLKVDFDMTLLVIASGLYRLMARRMRGYGDAQARQIFRDLIDTPADVTARDKESGHTSAPPSRASTDAEPALNIEVRARGLNLTEAHRAEVSRRLLFSLGRFGRQVEGVMLRMDDVNGPRSGPDKRFQISARLLRGETVPDRRTPR